MYIKKPFDNNETISSAHDTKDLTFTPRQHNGSIPTQVDHQMTCQY